MLESFARAIMVCMRLVVEKTVFPFFSLFSVSTVENGKFRCTLTNVSVCRQILANIIFGALFCVPADVTSKLGKIPPDGMGLGICVGLRENCS